MLITGVSGYLGRRLVGALADGRTAGRIIGIDIVPPICNNANLFFHCMDIRFPGVRKLILENQVDTVMHLAFVVKPIHDLKRMYDIAFSGTKNILEQSRAAGVKHVVVISSTLAYGAHPDNPEELREESPCAATGHSPMGTRRPIWIEWCSSLPPRTRR